MPGIKLGWDPDTVDISGVRFEVRLAGTGEVIHQGETDSFAAGSIIISHNLISDTAYQARGKYRPASVRDVTWSDWLDVTTPDVRTTTLTSLENSLRDLVTTEFQRVTESADRTAAMIASVAAEQDAANWIDKYGVRTLVKSNVDTLTETISEAVASSEVYADGAISAYDITVAATYATTTAVATARSEAISVAATNADVAIAAYDVTVQATYATPSNVATAKTEAISAAVATADAALAAYSLTVDASIGGGTNTVTVTIASPAVVTWAAHGFLAGQAIRFTTTGALPTGIVASTWYYVISAGLATDTFRIATAIGGSAINTSGSQSGVHTAETQGLYASTTTNAISSVTLSSSLSSLETSTLAALNGKSAAVAITIASPGSIRALAAAATGIARSRIMRASESRWIVPS